jgi:asparagine synthase (glutamine-hydrolysing)
MLVGAWGDEAGARLGRLHEREHGRAQRIGQLTINGPSCERYGSWSCWITGRLSNESELRERFGMPADTGASALVARLYAKLGPSAHEHLRGSFLVVALGEGRASVVRDHLGGRPLVYARVGDGVLFSEHARDLLDLMSATPGPDRASVIQWIDTGTLPARRSLHEGIHRLAPAHRLALSSGRVAIECYWYPRYEGAFEDSRTGVVERVRSEAFGAIARAAEGSLHPALRLSGGLDSSCVAAGLSWCLPDPSKAVAFGAVFPEHPGTDESALIQATARHTGLTLRQVAFDARRSILSPALRHLARWRLPPATPNLFVWEPVMALARELGIDVMLDGEGGDELFGLAPQLIADRLRAGRIPSAWSLTGGIPGIGAHPSRRIRLRALRVFGLRPMVPWRVRRWRRRRATRARDPLLRQADLHELVRLEEPLLGNDLEGPMWWQARAGVLIGGDSAFDVSAHMRREALDERIDRRHPFLHDLELVCAMLRVPPSMQFDALRDRALLRDALKDRVPAAVLTRDAKSSFTPVMLTGLARDRDVLISQLAQKNTPVRGYVRGDGLDALLEIEPADAMSLAQLWRVGMVDSWLRLGERPDYPQELERTIRHVDRA